MYTVINFPPRYCLLFPWVMYVVTSFCFFGICTVSYSNSFMYTNVEITIFICKKHMQGELVHSFITGIFDCASFVCFFFIEFVFTMCDVKIVKKTILFYINSLETKVYSMCSKLKSTIFKLGRVQPLNYSIAWFLCSELCLFSEICNALLLKQN